MTRANVPVAARPPASQRPSSAWCRRRLFFGAAGAVDEASPVGSVVIFVAVFDLEALVLVLVLFVLLVGVVAP